MAMASCLHCTHVCMHTAVVGIYVIQEVLLLSFKPCTNSLGP